MKIHEFYRHSAEQYISAALAALFPVVLLVTFNLIVLQVQEMLILSLPFLLYSFSCFLLFQIKQKQYINSYRDVRNLKGKSHEFQTCPFFLTADGEEGCEKIILFHPDGSSLGELRKKDDGILLSIKRLFLSQNDVEEYVFVDQYENLRSIYLINRKKRRMEVLDAERERIGSFVWFRRSGFNIHGQFLQKDGTVLASFKSAWLYKDERIYIQHKELVKYQKGRLAPELQNRFSNCNIPVLEMDLTLKETEKYLFLALVLDIR